jgi:FecR protein
MNPISWAFAIVLACASGWAAAADIGRVVLAAGETSALRQGQVVRLALGTRVQDQDVLRTGAASNLQVRFDDDSYVSLRESSELRVDQFRFNGGTGKDESAVFSLLKGGLRAVSGLIGRVNHDDYKMTTPTATIGIRGTDYAATLCQGDCRNPDGSQARDGLYGRVIGQSQGTNQINVSNDAGAKLLGVNANFFVGDRRGAVELLLVAPEFVLSKLEGRGRGTGTAGGTGSERASSGGASDESRPSTTPDPLPQLQFITTQNLNAQGTPAVLAPANGFVVAYPLPGNSLLGDVFFNDSATGGTFNGQNQLTAYGVAGTFPSGSLNGGSITDTGGFTLSNGQSFSYGRWTGNTTVFNGSTFAGAPVLFGTATGLGAGSVVGSLGGVATYTYSGGPSPVDAAGNVGSITSTSATINFTTQTAQLALGINFPSVVVSTVNTGSAAFTVSGPAFHTNVPFLGEFVGGLSGTCTGGGCFSGSASGFYEVGLTGPGGYGLAVIGGVIDGTNAGDVAFLNSYQVSSFTPAAAAITGEVAWGNASPSVLNVANLNPSQLTVSGSNLTAFGDGTTFASGSLGSGTIVETGSVALVDGSTMNWGRWTGAAQAISSPGNVTISPGTGVPFVLGSANAVVPTSGTFLYSYAGGPNPVNTSGTVGTFGGGAFNVSFGASSGSLSIATPLTLAVGGVSYSLGSCTSGCTFTNLNPVAGTMSLSGTCSGGACSTGSTAFGTASGIFVGPQAGGLAVAGIVSPGVPAPSVAFGAAFKR